jgi:hypothetical protein
LWGTHNLIEILSDRKGPVPSASDHEASVFQTTENTYDHDPIGRQGEVINHQ